MSNNSLVDSIQGILVPIHKEGYPFIALFAIGAFILGLIWEPLGWIGVVLTLWCIYFFRDPERIVPEGDNAVIAPADGVLQQITRAAPPEELEMGASELTRLSIFMNVFNVHVNRMPVNGTVTGMHYFPGAFLNASLDKASEENERQALKITTADGQDIAMVQIAGLVARRIVTYAEKGDKAEAGHRFGIIRFGSRVDVYLPEGVNPLVAEGQTILAGETILAELNSSHAQRTAHRV
jgi:phosphatidylserine decarboxylase